MTALIGLLVIILLVVICISLGVLVMFAVSVVEDGGRSEGFRDHWRWFCNENWKDQTLGNRLGVLLLSSVVGFVASLTIGVIGFFAHIIGMLIIG